MAERFLLLLGAVDETFAATGLVVRDKDGNPRGRAKNGKAIGAETDERGRLVPAGHGYLWGRARAGGDAEG